MYDICTVFISFSWYKRIVNPLSSTLLNVLCSVGLDKCVSHRFEHVRLFFLFILTTVLKSNNVTEFSLRTNNIYTYNEYVREND